MKVLGSTLLRFRGPFSVDFRGKFPFSYSAIFKNFFVENQRTSSWLVFKGNSFSQAMFENFLVNNRRTYLLVGFQGEFFFSGDVRKFSG